MHIKKTWLAILVLLLLISPIITLNSSADNINSYWNKDWSYRQEIILPINTNEPNAKLQPVDIRVKFENPCWAKNELEHSIRVTCWDGKNWYELESQIYNLESKSATILESCNLVFLIPETAEGNEKYFVYYDKSEKNAPNYQDHVEVLDEYYYFENAKFITNWVKEQDWR